jgi:hypothetical protein
MAKHTQMANRTASGDSAAPTGLTDRLVWFMGAYLACPVISDFVAWAV